MRDCKPELAQHAGHGRLDGRLFDRQATGDLPVRHPLAQAVEHLALQLGEVLRHQMRSFGRWMIAAVLTAGVIGLLAVTVAGAEQRADLLGVLPALGVVTVLWLLSGPVWVLGSAVVERAPTGHTAPGSP